MLLTRNLIASPFVYILTAIPVIFMAIMKKSFKRITPNVALTLFVIVNTLVSVPLLLVRNADKETNKSAAGGFANLIPFVIICALALAYTISKSNTMGVCTTSTTMNYVALGVVTTVVLLNNIKALI